jgi:hypothetical protein
MTMSLGAERVRLDFNPGGNELVADIKRKTVALIDICGGLADAAKDGEERRLWSLAMTHYEDAAMWAVKAATYAKP